jgi:AraC-like DNA-binding protein
MAAILAAMEITDTHCRLRDMRSSGPSTVRIERGRAVVLVAAQCSLVATVRAGDLVWPVVVPPGQRALLCAGQAPLSLEGALDSSPVPASTLSRWMAFRDAAFEAPSPGSLPRHPFLLICAEEIEIPERLAGFLIDLLRRDSDSHERLRTHVASGEHYQIARFVLAEGPAARVGELANAYGLSATHFRRRCGEVFGRPAKDQLRELRASHALLQYQGSHTTLCELALEAGYASQSHFSDEIKAFVGLAPRHIYKAVHQ